MTPSEFPRRWIFCIDFGLTVRRWDSGGFNNIHTVDEHISVMNHIGMVKWFTLFVRNIDDADLED